MSLVYIVQACNELLRKLFLYELAMVLARTEKKCEPDQQHPEVESSGRPWWWLSGCWTPAIGSPLKCCTESRRQFTADALSREDKPEGGESTIPAGNYWGSILGK
jgi:hypothetical protein